MNTVNPINTDHSNDTNNHNSNSSTTATTGNHGRTHFLRHFSHQNDTDGSFVSSSHSQQQPSSPIQLMKKSHRLIRSLTARTYHSNTNATTTATTQNIPSVIVQQQGDTSDNISPVSVTSTANPFQVQPPPLSSPNSSSVGKHIKDTKGKLRLQLGRFLSQHHNNEEQITFHSSEDTTRLGISPTCYDLSDAGPTPVDTPISAATLPSSFALSASTSSMSNTTIFTIPNIFSGPAIWEEACTLDEFMSSNDEKTEECNASSKLVRGSPQKSIDSFDDNKSSSLDGSFINYENVDEGSWKYSSAASHGETTGSCFGSTSHKNSEYNATMKISSNNWKSGKNKRSLINKAKSIVQRAREKEHNQSFLCNSSVASATGCGAISSCNSSVVSTTSSRSNKSFIRMTKKKSNAAPTIVDNVKIFLLLVEPNTKVFELIQLLYPRNTTKVVDLLHMIPKHATEPILAQQSYIGITRPKRRSEPIMDVQMFASNNNNTSALPTTLLNAAIESGEIIVALPQYTNTKEIISLSKQILASSHIQQLIVLSSISNKNANPGSSTDPTNHHFNQVVTVKDKYHKKKKKRSSSNSILKCDNTAGSTTTTTTISATLSEDSPTSYSTTTNNSSISSQNTIVQESAAVSDKEMKSPKVVSFVDQTSRNIDISSCAERCIRRAVERAHNANEEVVAPSVTTLLCESIPITQQSLSKSVISGDFSDSNSHCIAESHDDDEDDDFAFRNMLDAYLSKDIVLKMCSTPNHSKVSSRDVNPSSLVLVDDDECINNNDTASCCDDDGSITSSGSSLHSWAHRSLDTSSIPSLSSKATLRRLHQQHATATDLNSPITTKPKRFLTKKKVKRGAFIVFLASIIRYHYDPNGIHSTDDQRIRRSQILFEPMGWIGFLYFIIVFATFVKFQKCHRRRNNGKPIVGPGETPITRCPVVKVVAKLKKKFYATIGGKEKSNTPNNDSQHRRHSSQFLVPSSIHAIHFE